MSDLISRQAVLDGIAEWIVNGYADSEADCSHISSLVTHLPSVENKGEWIYQEGVTPYKWRCNKCEKMFKTDFNYCPNCGADMRGKSCRCNTCKNNDDELSGECYECLKGMYDHYEKENKTEVENGRTND